MQLACGIVVNTVKTELRKLCHAFWMKKLKMKSYHLGIGLLTPKVGCGHNSGEVQVLAKVDQACVTSYNWTPWAEFAESLSNPSGRKMAADEFQINWKNHIIFCLFCFSFIYLDREFRRAQTLGFHSRHGYRKIQEKFTIFSLAIAKGELCKMEIRGSKKQKANKNSTLCLDSQLMLVLYLITMQSPRTSNENSKLLLQPVTPSAPKNKERLLYFSLPKS